MEMMKLDTNVKKYIDKMNNITYNIIIETQMPKEKED